LPSFGLRIKKPGDIMKTTIAVATRATSKTAKAKSINERIAIAPSIIKPFHVLISWSVIDFIEFLIS
jgi:hypothetical protein